MTSNVPCILVYLTVCGTVPEIGESLSCIWSNDSISAGLEKLKSTVSGLTVVMEFVLEIYETTNVSCLHRE